MTSSPAVAAPEHPALVAWRELCPTAPEHAAVEALKVRKSAIHRVHGAAPDGSALICKLGRRQHLETERAVYDRILPALGFSALRCYGLLPAGDGRAWLFVEDAGPEVPMSEAERNQVAGWLAALHSASPPKRLRGLLADRGPGHHLDQLLAARTALLGHLHDRRLAAADRRVLAAIAGQLDLVEARWPLIEELCDRMPRGLVHGDLLPKNVRVRDGDCLAFDWEESGWGVPAADLVEFDGRPAAVAAYGRALGRTDVTEAELRRLTALGVVLWLLRVLRLESPALDQPVSARLVRKLHAYRAMLDAAVGRAGLGA